MLDLAAAVIEEQFFAAVHESLYGTFRKFYSVRLTSALEAKADIPHSNIRPAKSSAVVFLLFPFPQSVGFAGEHRGPRDGGCPWITIQDPADKIWRQPGEMN